MTGMVGQCDIDVCKFTFDSVSNVVLTGAHPAGGDGTTTKTQTFIDVTVNEPYSLLISLPHLHMLP
jgi:hypothetical protein